jgi:putative glutamine amidotransferase
MPKNAPKMPSRPVVGIPCDYRIIGPHPFHAVGEKYITAVEGGANALPLLIPVLAKPLDTDEVLSGLDGLLFTGSPSNVSPKLYGGTPPREGVLQDEYRDATTLPLMKRAIAIGMPTLCLCRGFQELNVAFGGTLYQHLHEVPGRMDHRENKSDPLEVQYGPAHDVSVAPGGLLERIARDAGVTCPEFAVNSVHGQGIDQLAPGLAIEASAPDGSIEAVTVKNAKGFVLALQWHPEWKYAENKVSSAIFKAFGDALRTYAKQRHKELAG